VVFGFAAAVSALVVALAPRFLASEADTAVFITFWSAFGVCSGVLTGLQLEVTRNVSTQPTEPPESSNTTIDARQPSSALDRATNPRVALVGIAIGVILSSLLTLTAFWWGRQLFSLYSHPTILAVVIAIGVIGLTSGLIIGGGFLGIQDWKLFTTFAVADTTARLVLILPVMLITRSVIASAAATTIAAFMFLGFLAFSKQTKGVLNIRSDVPLRALLPRFGASVASTGASAILVAGLPILIAITTPDAEFAAAAPLLLAIVLTRAPLMLPVSAMQGVAIAHFVKNRSSGLRTIWPFARILIGVGLLGTLLAGLIGPSLMTLVGGPDYRLSGYVLAGLTFGAAGLALLTLTGVLCQAVAAYPALVGGWLTAVVVSILCLTLPLPLELRTVLALIIGSVVGIVVHLVALNAGGKAA